MGLIGTPSLRRDGFKEVKTGFAPLGALAGRIAANPTTVAVLRQNP
jgi:hypothetical protein